MFVGVMLLLPDAVNQKPQSNNIFCAIKWTVDLTREVEGTLFN